MRAYCDLEEIEAESVNEQPPGVARVPNWGRTAHAIVVGVRPLAVTSALNEESIRKLLTRGWKPPTRRRRVART